MHSISGHRGEVIVKVESFDAARERILQSLSVQGGSLLDAQTLVNEKGRKHGWMKVRLAGDRLGDALPVIRSAGKLSAENITTWDQTSEYESLQRRADRLGEHQTRLAGILSSERRLRGSDVLYVQERLFRASVDEGLLLQKREDLSRDSRFCTLTIRLFEPMPTRMVDRVRLDVAGHFTSAKARALSIVDRNRARAVTASAYVLVFAPLWVPLLILAVFAAKFFLRFVAYPLWQRRQEILLRLRAAAVVLYAGLPDRFRQPLTSVHGVLNSGPSQPSPLPSEE
ncbi:MAG: DUF4349 domain-containing protein [Armatimonadota bacterium]